MPVRIWLCADDYGMSLSVNAAIRELLARGRINATSVMVVAPGLQRAETDALDALRAGVPHAAIGLHVTLTAPFRPLTRAFAPTLADAFLPLRTTLMHACLHRFQHERLAGEIAAQIDAFAAAFGRLPDFVDGHQHVQLFPQVREAFLATVKTGAPRAWVRQCGRRMPLLRRFADPKGLILDLLSRPFRARAAALGVPTNPMFAGTYGFSAAARYSELFETFLDRMTDNGVIMCHPGFVDDELRRLDRLTALREREYAFFADEKFPRVLEARGIELARIDRAMA